MTKDQRLIAKDKTIEGSLVVGHLSLDKNQKVNS